MPRVVRACVFAAALAAALVFAPGRPGAQEPPRFQFRLYYSPLFSSHIEKTPFDGSGRYDAEPADTAQKIEAEIIMFRYFGVSAARIPFYRDFKADGETVNEHAEEQFFSIALYATEVRHDSWNVFIGTGWGEVAQYQFKVDGVRQDTAPLHRNIPLTRLYGGLEYTWERLGVRLEYNRITGENESEGQKAKLDQTFQYLTFFIPFN
jgi:hypothetical protein